MGLSKNILRLLMPDQNKEWVTAEVLIWLDDELDVFEEDDDEQRIAILGDWYPEWHAKAACLGDYEAADNFFYGQDERGIRPSLSAGQIKKAREFCAKCEVVTDCLETALSSREKYGVWGGTTGRFRRQLFTMMDEGYIDLAGAIRECLTMLLGFKAGKKYEL
jgi:WhiB family redox-sensing transcriptional regulator